MKKIAKLMTVLVLGLTLAACGSTATKDSEAADTAASTTATSEKAETVKVAVALQEDGKDFDSKDVEVEKDTTIYDLMVKNFDAKDEGGFITSIDGKEQDKDKNIYWTYTVNGEAATKGAKEIKVNDGDKIVFNLAGM